MSSESPPPALPVTPFSAASPGAATVPAAEITNEQEPPSAPKAAVPPSVRIEGLAETLHEVRHELGLLSAAHRYNWINQRLILLRNFIIAMSVIVGVAVVVTMCYREAYRQTLTISPFDVPEKLAERGITGQVVAKALFDELIKRRKTVTTLDAGDLKGAWTENRSDVAVPETKLTFQSVFRYLRHLTGNEVAVDGEMLIDGDNVTIKARVAGNPPRAVKGKLADWESLLGELANYVYETTQPAVLASYLGLTARTPQDLASLSIHIQKMMASNPKPHDSVMAVAYEAYGSALIRQDKADEALIAFRRAMSYDPEFGLAVLNAANTNFRIGDYSLSVELYKKAFQMKLPDSTRSFALRRRIAAEYNRRDCPASAAATREAYAFPKYDRKQFDFMEAHYLGSCEYEEAKGVAMLRDAITLHPESDNHWLYLGIAYGRRPGTRFRQQAIDTYRHDIALGRATNFAYFNLAADLARAGETEQALAAYNDGKQKLKSETPDTQYTLATILHHKGEYHSAEDLIRRTIAKPQNATPYHYELLGEIIGRLGRFDEALVTFRTGQKLFPTYCALYDEAGKLLLKQQRTQEAFAEFDRGIAAVKKCGLPYISHARVLIEMKRVPEARAKLNELIKVAPASDGAEEAKEILATLGKAG